MLTLQRIISYDKTNYLKMYTKDQSEGWIPEDCVVYILEWVLDWNECRWDYTDREFDK